MRNLKDCSAPSNQARKQEVITNWLKAIKRPNKGIDLEKWLQDLEIAYDSAVREQIPDITDLRAYYAFIKAIAIIDPIFAANCEDEFIELEEKNQVDLLLFKEIIRKFRKTKRVQANRERIEKAQHGAFATFQGKNLDGTLKVYTCICNSKYKYTDCYYLVPIAKLKDWILNLIEVKRINDEMAKMPPRKKAQIRRAQDYAASNPKGTN